jgi:hypothetical protein
MINNNMITTISSLSKGSPTKGTIQGKSESTQAFRPSKGTTTTVIPTSPSKDKIHQPTIRHLEASIRIISP